jgi:hypothetical protein
VGLQRDEGLVPPGIIQTRYGPRFPLVRPRGTFIGMAICPKPVITPALAAQSSADARQAPLHLRSENSSVASEIVIFRHTRWPVVGRQVAGPSERTMLAGLSEILNLLRVGRFTGLHDP